ncbi:alpha/beta fold hydrolase [Paraburkholderia sp. GAS32]|uniref:alpha/beta fold hydrolase n=1 Tax=Paraburkholderia sp. GAS32 TaxID=3035129 RepID=UPI003D2571FB
MNPDELISFQLFAGKSGLPLAADVGGNPDGICVILSPGAGQTRHSWRRLAKHLTVQGYRVISLDLRGHGESKWAPDGDYAIEAFVDDLSAVMDTQDGPLVLIGASIGGIASLLAVARHPPLQIRGLVLVDVVPNMQAAGLERIRGFMSAGEDGFAHIDDAADAVARYLPHRRRPVSSANLAKNLRRGENGRWYWHWDPAFHAGSKQRAEEGMLAKMESAATSIAVPTLLVSGSLSEVVDTAGATRLLQLIPHAQWVNVQDAAHMVAGDRNDIFDAAIDSFVRRVSANRGDTQP